MWPFTLGTDADGLLSQDNFVDLLSLSGDISMIVFVTMSKIGTGPVPFSKKEQTWLEKVKSLEVTPRVGLASSSTLQDLIPTLLDDVGYILKMCIHCGS